MDKKNATLTHSDHPSKDILESYSSQLRGKSICVCVTGSVAAVNTPALCRELMRHGAEVFTVMTTAATKLIHPDLLHWSTGNPVVLELTGKIEHIALAGERPGKLGKADLVIVAPSTANTISKIACGIDDTPVTTVVTTAFGSRTPIIIVPAMHESMYQHPIVKENIDKLQKLGVDVILPRVVEGKAKIAETSNIVSFIIDKFNTTKILQGKNFLITTGPSREMIDRVRFISNPSSGKTGIAFAEEILAEGGSVTLLSGPGTPPAPVGATEIRVTTALDFITTMEQQLNDHQFDVLISAAALADFTPLEKQEQKISSDLDSLTLKLKKTQKLISKARELKPDLFIVAFKAETDLNEQALIERAYSRLNSAQANLIVANNVHEKNSGRGFGSNTNEVFVIKQDKEVIHIPLCQKREMAKKILEIIDNITK